MMPAMLTGGGYKIGIGYTGLPFVSINFDMLALNYDEGKMKGPLAVNVTKVDLDRATYLLGLSFPFGG